MAKAKLKAGDRVMVYEHPFTKESPEGPAVLVEHQDVRGGHANGRTCETWLVRFVGHDDGPYARLVCADDRVAPAVPGPSVHEQAADIWHAAGDAMARSGDPAQVPVIAAGAEDAVAALYRSRGLEDLPVS